MLSNVFSNLIIMTHYVCAIYLNVPECSYIYLNKIKSRFKLEQLVKKPPYFRSPNNYLSTHDDSYRQKFAFLCPF